MEIFDEFIIKYYNLVIDVYFDEVNKIEFQLKEGLVNLRDIKMNLVREIVILYYGEEFVKEVEERFKFVF